MVLRGIQFVVDDAGKKTAAVIDLKRHRRLWEDLYDRLIAEARKDEPRESLGQVKKLLGRKWKRSHG